MHIEDLTATGVAGSIIAVILILREVFAFLDRQQAKKSGSTKQAAFTYRDRNMLEDLHKWHDREDVDGIKVWYVRSSLEKSVDKLGDAIEHMTKNQDAQLRALERLCEEVQRRRPPTEDGL